MEHSKSYHKIAHLFQNVKENLYIIKGKKKISFITLKHLNLCSKKKPQQKHRRNGENV